LARSVPLSRFASRVGAGSAFSLGRYAKRKRTKPKRQPRFTRAGAEVPRLFSLPSQTQCHEEFAHLFGSRSERLRVCRASRIRYVLHSPAVVGDFSPKRGKLMILIYQPWPNKSPEPTAVGAGSSAVAVHVASRRWLSFFR
jgi:hypothetical protein